MMENWVVSHRFLFPGIFVRTASGFSLSTTLSCGLQSPTSPPSRQVNWEKIRHPTGTKKQFQRCCCERAEILCLIHDADGAVKRRYDTPMAKQKDYGHLIWKITKKGLRPLTQSPRNSPLGVLVVLTPERPLCSSPRPVRNREECLALVHCGLHYCHVRHQTAAQHFGKRSPTYL